MAQRKLLKFQATAYDGAGGASGTNQGLIEFADGDTIPVSNVPVLPQSKIAGLDAALIQLNVDLEAHTHAAAEITDFDTAVAALTLNPVKVSQTADYRFVSDTEKATWNAKQSSLGYAPENSANKATDFTVVNNTKFPTVAASKTYFDNRFTELIGTAPANLDTLQELGAQLVNEGSAVAALTTTVAGKQPGNAHLTAIAALNPTANDLLQYKSGNWASRSIAQFKTDLNYTFGEFLPVVAGQSAKFLSNDGTSLNWAAIDLSGYASLSGAVFTGKIESTGYIKFDGENTSIGYLAGFSTTSGNYNAFFGVSSGRQTTTGSENVFLGWRAGFSNLSGIRNVCVGLGAGYNSNGSDNVLLGYYAGLGETGSNKLYVANTGTTAPLIYGEFDNSLLRVNGRFEALDASGNAQIKASYYANVYTDFRTDSSGNTLFSNTGSFYTFNNKVGINIANPLFFLDVNSTLKGVARFNSSQAGNTSNISLYNLSSWYYGVAGIVSGNNTSLGDVWGLGWTGNNNDSFIPVLSWTVLGVEIQGTLKLLDGTIKQVKFDTAADGKKALYIDA